MVEKKINYGRIDYTEIDQILKANPKMTFSEFKKLGFKCSAFSFHDRLKFLKTGVKRAYLNNPNKKKRKTKKRKYTRRNLSQISGKLNIHRVDSKTKEFLALLEGGNKITAEAAAIKLGCHKKIIYGIAFRLRKKIDLQNDGGLYFLTPISNAVPVTVSNHQPTTKPLNGKSASMKDLRSLPESDLEDYLQNMKQSIFYGLTAQAVVESNKAIKIAKEQVLSGI